jgi:hypothetical protein
MSFFFPSFPAGLPFFSATAFLPLPFFPFIQEVMHVVSINDDIQSKIKLQHQDQITIFFASSASRNASIIVCRATE